MTIPKRGTRRVRFGETYYDWRIRKKPTDSQLVGDTPMLLAIQASEDVPRCVLVVKVCTRPDNLRFPHQTAVVPGQVRDMIRLALAAGWKPLVAGPQFHFEYGIVKWSVGCIFPEYKPKELPTQRIRKTRVMRKLNKPLSRDSRRPAPGESI